MSIRQDTQPVPVLHDSGDILAAFEVSIETEPAPEVSDILCDSTSSLVGEMSSSFVLDNVHVDQFEEDCATIAMHSGVPISDDPVLVNSEETERLQRKASTHECSGNCLQ